MLVLTRRENEAVAIGNTVRIVVLSVEGDRVRLGIEAPKSIRVFREELIKETEDENRMAAASAFAAFEPAAGDGGENPAD